MKKLISQNKSTLFIIIGIVWLFLAVIGDDIDYVYACVGFTFITIGISKRKKESDEDSEEGELLTDEEEKQVWKEYKGKVEDDENSTS